MCLFAIIKGIPLMGTLPHFYLAEELLESVESGLNPDHEKHATFSVFEMVSSVHCPFFLNTFYIVIYRANYGI